MAVHDPAGDPTDAERATDGRETPMSEHTIVVVTDADRPVERWIGDRYSIRYGLEGDETTDADFVVVGPEQGAEIGLETDGGAVVASLTGTDRADVAGSARLGTSFEGETLLETIDRLDRRARYDALLAEYARLAAQRGEMETGREEDDLAEDHEYQELRRRLTDVEADLDEVTRTFDGEDFRAAFETGGFGGACERAD